MLDTGGAERKTTIGRTIWQWVAVELCCWVDDDGLDNECHSFIHIHIHTDKHSNPHTDTHTYTHTHIHTKNTQGK